MKQSNVCLIALPALLALACSHGVAQTLELASYQQLITELEAGQSSAGLDLQLSEAYYGLGISLQTLERHEEAVAAFDKALQAVKEEKGLYDLAQLPMLQAQLDSQQALQAWEAVDAGRHLAHLITVKKPAASIEQRYQTLRELGLWKLKSADEELLPNSLADAKEAAQLYRHELERPTDRAEYQRSPLSMANLYLDLAAIEFLLASKKLALPLSAYVTGGQRTITQMYCETIATPDGRGRQVCRNIQMPNLDYFMSLTDRKYEQIWDHLDAMEEAVLEAYKVLLPAVETERRDEALQLLSEVHRMTSASNDFVAANARRGATRIAATGSRIDK
ncbi:MAG: tetratricopeptide repeat protein [Pseudomonadota bacterium]